VSAAPRPPLAWPDSPQVGHIITMRCKRTFTLSYDEDASQAVLDDLPDGPGGGANVIAAPGLEFMFDCADAQLSRVFADTAGTTSGETDELITATADRLLGSEAGAALRQAPHKDGDPVVVATSAATMIALSRLARLDAAWMTSPVRPSPLWAVEAAELAEQAGLRARVAVEVRQAVEALDGANEMSPAVLAATASAVADLVAASDPDLAGRLRASAAASSARGPAAAHAQRSRPLSLPDGGVRGQRRGDLGQLHWWLDPDLVPSGIFRHALWPDTEVMVHPERSRLVVEATLASSADRRALTACRARLVDPANRTVLGMASFRDMGESRVRAEIRKRRPSHEAWVEIVDDESRPVHSGKLRHIRRAMRWADTALSAGRQTFRLADAEWIKVAAVAWGRCAEEWAAAGDRDRAYLAAAREAAMYPGVEARSEPRSPWAKELASRPLVTEQPFLAEKVT
jgi:hypothetical protein